MNVRYTDPLYRVTMGREPGT